MNKLLFLCCSLVLIMLFSAVSEQSYQDELDEQENYCDMVKQGAWPAYDDNVRCDK